jgi:O-antigen ligase
VGTVAAVLIFLPFQGGSGPAWRKVGRLVVTAALIGAVALALTRTEYLPSNLEDRVAETFTPEDDLQDNRLRLDAAGLRAFRESPLVGTGLDNFRHVSWVYGGGSDQAPHNMWIQFLAQVGLLGALAFAFIVARWFLLVLRARSASVTPARRELLWAFFASMTALMVIYMSNPLMIQRHHWLVFGLALAAARRGPEDRGEGPRGREPGTISA